MSGKGSEFQAAANKERRLLRQLPDRARYLPPSPKLRRAKGDSPSLGSRFDNRLGLFHNRADVAAAIYYL
jgi:hypothetical protein